MLLVGHRRRKDTLNCSARKFGLQYLTRDGTYKAIVFENADHRTRAWIDVQGVGDKPPDAASVLKAVGEKYGLVEK
jgi:hypothetical protein